MDNQLKTLINNLLRAVEFEREEERERHLNEMKHLSGQQREKKGRAIINLRKRKIGRLITGEYLYEFKKSGEIDTEIAVGDQVMISQESPLDLTNPTALVYEIHKKTITLALTKQLRMTNNNPIRIDLSVNDTTYKRMEETLIKIKSPEFSKLQKIMSGKYHVSAKEKAYSIKTLNPAQEQAVNLAFNNNGYYSIQGPPGTGKTYTAAHLIKDIISSGKRVLITADSNAAVDNLIRHCVNLGLDPLRLGNPIRVNTDLKSYTLDYRIFKHVLYDEIIESEMQFDRTKQKQSELKRPDAKDLHGFTYTQLIDYMERKPSSRGLGKVEMKALKPFLKLQKKLDVMHQKIQALRNEIQYELLMSHQIIATTNSTAGSTLLDDMHFDWAIIDEAAQASIPSSLIPISKVNRFVLIGDHYQLPPVVLNQGAKELGLGLSLMDYLAEKYPYFLSKLSRQYRMHQVINDLVSDMFYNESLIADETVKDRRVLKGSIVDIVHVLGQEVMQKDSKSYYNELEIDKVSELILDLQSKGIKDNQIAVISPYKAQTRKLQRIYPKIEIDTVDAFQGREKDVVIISFVRSNAENTLGFITDYRRLNVSISRAKSKLILVGNMRQLNTHKMYRSLMDKIKK